MKRKKIPLRTGFTPIALIELFSLHDRFGCLKADRSALVHYGIVSHLVAQERHVAALLGIVDDLASPLIVDSTDEVIFELSKWVGDVGGHKEFTGIKESICKNGYMLGRSCIPLFKQSFSNNAEFTCFIFQQSAKLQSQNIAKLKLRFLYLVSIYQTTLQHEYQRKRISSEINQLERRLRDTESRRRIRGELATPEDKGTEVRMRKEIAELTLDYEAERELAELDTMQVAWIPRLQKLTEIKSALLSPKLDKKTRMMLFTSKGSNDLKLSTGCYIYELIDEMEDEDRRIDPFAV